MSVIAKTNYPSHMLGRLFTNSAFLLTNDILTRATTFLLYALIARYLGAYQFGQLSLALTVLFTFQIFAPAGLKLLITREVAKNKEKTDLYLVNGSLIVVIFTLLSYLILSIVIVVLNYSQDTTEVIALIALGLLPFSLCTICEGIFQGWERMRFITLANLPRNLLILVFGYLLLSKGYGLHSIAWLLSMSYGFLILIEWVLIFRYISRPRPRIDINFILETIKTSMAFLGFQGTVAISNTLIFIMLSKYAGETSVGYFNAANQVLTPMLLIIQSFVLSVFPAMCRKFEISLQSLKTLSDNLIEFLLALTFPVVVALFYLADEVLMLLYGNKDFIRASGVLQIIISTLLLQAVASVLGRDLLAGHREKTLLKIVLVSSAVAAIFGFFLIYWLGLLGAAIASVIFGLVDFSLHYKYTSQLLPNPIPWRGLWKSCVASGVLIVFLLTFKILHPFITVLAGGVLYLIVWFCLDIWIAGGFKQLKIKYQILWSDN